MKPLIVFSTQDIAGKNIAKILKERGVETYEFMEKPYAIKNLPESRAGYIVVSKHKSQSGKASFTMHTVGNLSNDNSFGGEKMTAGMCNANWIKTGMLALNKHAKNFRYDVTLETTHHGPTHLKSPLVFIEVGGSEKQWINTEACRVVAKAVIDILESKKNYNSYVGFGGTHYPSKFTKFVLEEEGSIGIICPKYKIDCLTKETIEDMFKKTLPRTNTALIDKKSLRSAQRKRIISLIEELGKDYKLI